MTSFFKIKKRLTQFVWLGFLALSCIEEVDNLPEVNLGSELDDILVVEALKDVVDKQVDLF